MAKFSAPAGTYILTGQLYRQFQDDGSFIDHEEGDEVELSAREAARLLNGSIVSFVRKEDKDSIVKIEDGTKPPPPPRIDGRNTDDLSN